MRVTIIQTSLPIPIKTGKKVDLTEHDNTNGARGDRREMSIGKKFKVWLLTGILTVSAGWPVLLQAAYPEKPITILVHSKPGSGIDIASRQLAKIARKYTDATILVENKIGASGIIAMEELLSRKNDGYSVLAVTKSFISTILLIAPDTVLCLRIFIFGRRFISPMQ